MKFYFAANITQHFYMTFKNNNFTIFRDLNGQEGYCLATVQSTFANIIYREQEKEMSSHSVGDNS